VGVGQDALQPVLGQDDGQPQVAVEAHQRLQHLLGRPGVELGGGLVEHEDTRAQGQRSGDGDALLLAAGKCLQRAVAQREQIQQAQRLLDAHAHLGRGDGRVLQRESDLVLDPINDELRLGILEDKSDETAEYLRPLGDGVAPGDGDASTQSAAGEVGHQPVEAAQKRGLARAGRPRHEDELSLGDVQCRAGEGGVGGVRIGVGEMVEVNHRLMTTAGTSNPSNPNPMSGSKGGRVRRG
jgi:hypothetical protein